MLVIIRVFGILSFFMLFFGAGAVPSHAGLVFCNETGQKLSTAVAWDLDNDWKSQGWFNLAPQECALVVQGDLKHRYYWYYAHTKDLTWSGQDDQHAAFFCTSPKAFFFRNAN